MILGDRIKLIRTDVIKQSQEDFCVNLNKFVKTKYSKEAINKENLLFTQSMISKIENDEVLTTKKLIIVLNYFYQKFRINPNWIILENNNSTPLYSTKIEIDTSLVEIYDNIENHSKEILRRVTDLSIIIQNSTISK